VTLIGRLGSALDRECLGSLSQRAAHKVSDQREWHGKKYLPVLWILVDRNDECHNDRYAENNCELLHSNSPKSNAPAEPRARAGGFCESGELRAETSFGKVDTR